MTSESGSTNTTSNNTSFRVIPIVWNRCSPASYMK
jgi:hypothetical protein